MRRWFREPLFHFALLGGALFLLHAWRQGGPGAGADDARPVIEVTAGTIQSLTARWAKQFNRWPTPEETRGLIDDHVREEVLYREALALGLDRDDAILKRRLAQKLEFVLEDVTTPPEPDDATLAAWFDLHAARYAKPARMTLKHAYFSLERRGDAAAGDARRALESLRSPATSIEDVGDPFLLGNGVSDQSERDVSDVFGPAFAATAVSAPIGSWVGPVESSYGAHLVNVSARHERTPAALADVRDAVVRDFAEERRRQANRAVFERLRDRYRIEVAAPPAGGSPAPTPK